MAAPTSPSTPSDPGAVTWEAFWAHVDEGRVCLPVCAGCGRANWYPSSRCRSCGGAAFTWSALSGRATVFVSLLVFRDFAGEGRDVPYEVALVVPVEHPEVRLLARVEPAVSLRAEDAVTVRAGAVGERPVVVAAPASAEPGSPA